MEVTYSSTGAPILTAAPPVREPILDTFALWFAIAGGLVIVACYLARYRERVRGKHA